MPDHPITQRDLESLRVTIDKLDRTLDRFRTEFEQIYVRKDVLEPRLKELETSQEEARQRWEWAIRIVLAVVIVALLSLVIVQPGGVGP